MSSGIAVAAIGLHNRALAFSAAVAPPFLAVVTDSAGLPDLSGIPAGTAALFALHGIERWTDDLARTALGRIKLILRPGGVLRVATPDLDTVVHNYLFEWVKEEGAISRGQRFNRWRRALDAWWVYNEEDLTAMLAETGFTEIRRFVVGSGSQPAFCDLDVGELDLLVLEARRAQNRGHDASTPGFADIFPPS